MEKQRLFFFLKYTLNLLSNKLLKSSLGQIKGILLLVHGEKDWVLQPLMAISRSISQTTHLLNRSVHSASIYFRASRHEKVKNTSVNGKSGSKFEAILLTSCAHCLIS